MCILIIEHFTSPAYAVADCEHSVAVSADSQHMSPANCSMTEEDAHCFGRLCNNVMVAVTIFCSSMRHSRCLLHCNVGLLVSILPRPSGEDAGSPDPLKENCKCSCRQCNSYN
jgi:hypothetical protein